MDFAALMSKEISKAKGPPPSNTSDQKDKDQPQQQQEDSSKKYIRRGEAEAARVATYHTEQERARREREERLTQKRKLDDEEAERRRERDEKRARLAQDSRKKRDEEENLRERERRKKLGLPELPPKAAKEEEQEGTGEGADKGEKEEEEDIPDSELTGRLRELNEPAQLFGETHATRLRRYRRLYARAMTPKPQLSNTPIPTTLPLVPEIEMKISTHIPKDTAGRTFLFRQLASFFNMVLGEWEYALSRRDLSVKQSLTGRQAYNAMAQSRDNMKPLFRKMEKGDVTDDMLVPILEIVDKAQQRKYVDANDAYLRLSIGKAAWPIGVTMVGIHERSAREKLHHSDQQAHILSDEITRKYLQSIKRCLSFAQTRWPPDDQIQIMG